MKTVYAWVLSRVFKIATMTSSRPFRAYVCLVITFTAAFLALFLRLLARRLTKLPLWYDDYLAILAFVGTTHPLNISLRLITCIVMGGIIFWCRLMA